MLAADERGGHSQRVTDHFARPFGLEELASPRHEPDIAERGDAFVAGFGRLQDTLAGAALLEAYLELAGSVAACPSLTLVRLDSKCAGFQA